jgi:hypothetical protein
MLYRNKLKILFAIQILIGVGFCVGGLVIPALFIVGAAFLGGALGMLQGTMATSEGSGETPAPVVAANEHVHESAHTTISYDSHDVTNNLYQYRLYAPSEIVRPSAPSLEVRELHQSKSAPYLTLT